MSYLIIFNGIAMCGYAIFREYKLERDKRNVVKTTDQELKNDKINN